VLLPTPLCSYRSNGGGTKVSELQASIRGVGATYDTITVRFQELCQLTFYQRFQ
jgi:hypothetical protein